ncbi:MAG: V-type ATP synthase subunit E [Spirochaetia bacterium]
MDAQLQELIDVIKTEGVQTAEKQAEQIIASAEEKAGRITGEAEERAGALVEEARAEQVKLDQSGRETLKQAGRDLILSVQAKLGAMFKAVVNSAAGEAISADILENTIVTVVNAWSQGKTDSLDVIVSEADLNRLEQRLRGRLAERISAGTEIKPNNAVKTGFRVSTKDGALYYDFTVESLADALSSYVGPRLTAVLKEAAGSAAGAGA